METAGGLPKGFETWTDYTRYALESIQVQSPVGPRADEAKQAEWRPQSLVDRKRALGIDFGPRFCGVALSMGGVTSVPLGTLKTGEDWKDLAIKIAQMASTRRVKDIVIGQALEKDGTEGRIGRIARHFANILADTTLLMLGGHVSIFLWDERFSTLHAALRLSTRPRFDGTAFKAWIDGRRGLSVNAKALLDAEAARAILEHWLQKDPATEQLNKELSERISPSREACVSYLKYRKVRARLPRPPQPKEPAGEGVESFEWLDRNRDGDASYEEYKRTAEVDSWRLKASDYWGESHMDYLKGKQERLREEELKRERAERLKARAAESDDPFQKAIESKIVQNQEVYSKYLSGN